MCNVTPRCVCKLTFKITWPMKLSSRSRQIYFVRRCIASLSEPRASHISPVILLTRKVISLIALVFTESYKPNVKMTYLSRKAY